MAGKSYRDLVVWQKALVLAESIYQVTRSFPSDERFGLTSQGRRAAVSVPSNIAEGQGRESTRDFAKFLSIARGSLCELETQIILAERLRYITNESMQSVLELAAEVGRLLHGLSNSLRRDAN